MARATEQGFPNQPQAEKFGPPDLRQRTSTRQGRGYNTSYSRSQSAVSVGQSQVKIGVPYKFGGNDRNTGVDCSGLTQCIYRENGITIPRTAISQWQSKNFVNVTGPLQEGDLVFFDTGANRRSDNKIGNNTWVTHVAVVTRDGRIVHATSSRGTRTETVEEFLKRAPKARLLGTKRYNG